MPKQLSNIEKYHLDKDKPTVQADPLIVETVEVPDEIREHCTIQYKYYVDKQLPRNAKGWRVYSLRCNYCNKAIRSVELFVKHIEVCKGLDDDYVPKPRRHLGNGFV